MLEARAHTPTPDSTLAAGSIEGRTGDWQGSFWSATSIGAGIDGGIRCVFAASVPTDDLLWLVAAERECCRFFRFSITIDSRGVGLEVRAPDAARSIVELMFGCPV